MSISRTAKTITPTNEDRLFAAIETVDSLNTKDGGDTKEKFFDILGGLLQFTQPKLSSERWASPKLLSANKEWVYRNNDVIATEVSKMQFELYKVSLNKGEIVYDEIYNHPLLDLLDKPNNETTKSDALYVIQSHKKLAGDAFWLKIRNGRRVVALRSIDPTKIELNLRQPTPDDPTAIENFHYQDVINGQKVDVIYQPEDMIHLKKPNPSNPFRGMGVVETMADTIDLDSLTNTTTKTFFQKGAITNFVLSTEQKVTKEQLKRLKAEMRQEYAGADNAYKTMILGGGLKPEKVGFSNKDMEFLDQLEWYRDKIMCGFGNTLASLGMLDDVNRATHESAMIEWKRVTVKPDMDSIINSLNEFLVPEFGDNLILGYTDPIPEDREDKRDEVKSLYPLGVITLNEARELMDYESVENGEVFFLPMGGTLTEDAGLKPDDELDDEAVAIVDAEGDLAEDPMEDLDDSADDDARGGDE